jgi:hypothetical protein
MKRVKPVFIGIIAILLLGVIVWPAYAQTPGVIHAEVDRTNLSTNELLVLTVTVDATKGASTSPNMPPLDGFEVISRSTGSQISIINGDMTMSETYTFMLHPTTAGDLIIEPITVNINGQVFGTQPITIRVSQGTGQLQPRQQPNTGASGSFFPTIPGFPSFPNLPGFQFPSLPGIPSMPSAGLDAMEPTFSLDPSEAPPELNGQDLFVEAKVDNRTPFQGEQVIYRLRFYQGVELWDEIEYRGPSFTGLWHEQLPDQMVYSLESNGRNYRVTELLTTLFPTVVGEVAIEPSVVNIPGDVFSRDYRLETDPINLAVQPLPAGAPAGYQGAVGDYVIQADVDTDQTIINEPITLKVSLLGAGNLHTLPEPELNVESQWRAYDSQSNVETSFQNGKLSGSRTWDRLLVPTQAGALIIPPVQYHFFDPEQSIFKTISTAPIAVQVAGNTNLPQHVPPETEAKVRDTNASNAFIRPLKAPQEILDGSANLVTQPIFWALWGLPVVLFAGQLAWTQLRKRAPDAATRRSQGAAKTALKSLNGISKDSINDDIMAGQILLQYLSDKLNLRVAGMTMDELSQLLADRGVDKKVIGVIQSCLLASEMGRYAPNGVGSEVEDVVVDVTAEVIRDLEKVL